MKDDQVGKPDEADKKDGVRISLVPPPQKRGDLSSYNKRSDLDPDSVDRDHQQYTDWLAPEQRAYLAGALGTLGTGCIASGAVGLYIALVSDSGAADLLDILAWGAVPFVAGTVLLGLGFLALGGKK